MRLKDSLRESCIKKSGLKGDGTIKNTQLALRTGKETQPSGGNHLLEPFVGAGPMRALVRSGRVLQQGREGKKRGGKPLLPGAKTNVRENDGTFSKDPA